MDESGTYPVGTYIRNPAGSKHSPGSAKGCVLFVKLGAFQVMSLHQFGTVGTALVKWPAGERFVPHRHWGGEEIFAQ